MSIKLKLWGRNYCPVMVCDVCQQEINADRPGNFEYELFLDHMEHEQLLETSPVYFAHKSCTGLCEKLFRKSKESLWCTDNSERLGLYLAVNHTPFDSPGFLALAAAIVNISDTEFYGYNRRVYRGLPPDEPGIYFLWDGERLDYIGQSQNMEKRLSHHPIYNRKVHKVFYTIVQNSNVRETLEGLLIAILNPAKNLKWSNYSSLPGQSNHV